MIEQTEDPKLSTGASPSKCCQINNTVFIMPVYFTVFSKREAMFMHEICIMVESHHTVSSTVSSASFNSTMVLSSFPDRHEIVLCLFHVL